MDAGAGVDPLGEPAARAARRRASSAGGRSLASILDLSLPADLPESHLERSGRTPDAVEAGDFR